MADTNIQATPKTSVSAAKVSKKRTPLTTISGNEGTSGKKTKSEKTSSSITSSTKETQITTADVEMKNLAKRLADRMKVLSKDVLMSASQHKKLADLPIGSVLEVTRCEPITTFHGESYIIYYKHLEDGKEVSSTSICPKRMIGDSTAAIKYPSVMIYFCLVAKSNGMGSFHNMKRVEEGVSTASAIKKTLSHLRNMESWELQTLFEVKSLKSFNSPAVISYDAISYKTFADSSGKEEIVPVVSYAVRVNGKDVTGKLTIPSRYANRLKECVPGIIVYKGMNTSGSKKEYHDLAIMSTTDAELFLQGHSATNTDAENEELDRILHAMDENACEATFSNSHEDDMACENIMTSE